MVSVSKSSFAMRITEEVAMRMGFWKYNTMSLKLAHSAFHSPPKKATITKESYKVKIFDKSVIQCEDEFVLKEKLEKPYDIGEFVKRWNNTIGRKYKDLAEAKDGKVIIHKKSKRLTYDFSYFLPLVTRVEGPLIGDGDFVGTHEYKNPYYIKAHTYRVFVYGDKILDAYKTTDYNMSIPIEPYSFYTVSSIIKHINQSILQKLKKVIGPDYNIENHNAVFEVINQKTVLSLGSQTKMTMSNNIGTLFGYINKNFEESTPFISDESPLPLDSREQHLYIHSDIIAPIEYGDQKEYILSHFIHDKQSYYGLMEKQFEPIMFQPVIKQNIEKITIKITNGLHDQIRTSDVKTLVTLIFRRVK